MKIGDLVKVKSFASSDYGIVVSFNKYVDMFKVWFLSLEYDMEFYDYELEVISENR